MRQRRTKKERKQILSEYLSDRSQLRQILKKHKVTAILQKEGYHVSKDMVHKLMREMELFSFRTDAKREYEREMRRKRDHVEREFNPDRPNVIWVSDVTEIRHKNRKLYLSVSRSIPTVEVTISRRRW